ncbi:MAG TPA: hypothetical protein VGN34_04845 [Ktedonobacteraceae bacterium]|jgi:hypothetical protein
MSSKRGKKGNFVCIYFLLALPEQVTHVELSGLGHAASFEDRQQIPRVALYGSPG